MNRRRLLAAVPTVAGLSGCLSGGRSTSEGPDDPDDGDRKQQSKETTPSPTDTRLAALGNPPTICEESIPETTGIPAVTDPAFADGWARTEVEPLYGDELDAEDPVVGVTVGDRARAYPLAVLWYHEVVNDDFGGPLVVTFCPLCRSGLVADAVIDGEATPFLVSGLLWKAPRIQTEAREKRGDVFGAGRDATEVRNRSNLVMFDTTTRSYWSQILATAICGPMEGETLCVRPSTFTSLGAWREEHPDTEVLLPPPHSATDPRGTIR